MRSSFFHRLSTGASDLRRERRTKISHWKPERGNVSEDEFERRDWHVTVAPLLRLNSDLKYNKMMERTHREVGIIEQQAMQSLTSSPEIAMIRLIEAIIWIFRFSTWNHVVRLFISTPERKNEVCECRRKDVVPIRVLYPTPKLQGIFPGSRITEAMTRVSERVRISAWDQNSTSHDRTAIIDLHRA